MGIRIPARNKRTITKLKAISPLIATLILIAITIVGGVVVYRLFFSTGTAITSTVHAAISDVTVSAAAGVTLTLKNDGNIQWTILPNISNVSVTGASGPALVVVAVTGYTPNSLQTVAPGQSLAITITYTTGPTAGVTYNIRVKVTGTGTTGTFTTSVDILSIT